MSRPLSTLTSLICPASGLGVLGAALLLSACAASQTPGAASALPDVSRLAPAAACSALTGAKLPAAAIGLPTSGATITASELIAATAEGNANGEYCKVLGAIHPVDYTAPDIRFEVNLPTAWNRKTLQFGGGGLNGTVVTGLGRYAKQPDTESTPLARGYVTLGSDSGHQSAGGFDGSFYLNREALENFGHMQIKKTHDVALLLVHARYRAAPDYNYFIGGSQGGHEGFDAVQRYPDDYDGVVAGYPAHNVLMLHLSALAYARALQQNDGASWLSPTDIAYLTAAVYARCDGLDEAADGIISNVAACRQATAEFKLLDGGNPLRCVGGSDTGDGCLSDAQLQALNVIDSAYELGFRIYKDDPATGSVFPKWTPFEGSTFTDGGATNLGAEGPRQALQFAPGDATTRLAIAQDLSLDAIHDFDPRQHAGRIAALAPVLSANSIELDRFRANGGRLIYFHGLVDDFITPYSSIQYHERLLGRYGAEALGEFVRFYTIPGMGHQTGVFNARLATLDALENWVENAEAPGELLAIDANQPSMGRTRPVCPYPEWPRYRGTGDIDLAASFECVVP